MDTFGVIAVQYGVLLLLSTSSNDSSRRGRHGFFSCLSIRWLLCDDSSVRLLEASLPDELSIDQSVYIVFYHLKEPQDFPTGDEASANDLSGRESPSAETNTSQEKENNLPEIPPAPLPSSNRSPLNASLPYVNSSNFPVSETSNTNKQPLDASLNPVSETNNKPLDTSMNSPSVSITSLPQTANLTDQSISKQVTGIKKRKHKSSKPFSRAQLLDAVNQHAAGHGKTITPCCPDATLDQIDPVITEDDVPGARIDLNAIKSLRRKHILWWLKTRGLPLKGKKEVLLKRLLDHVKMGKGGRIDPKLRGGKFLRLKRKKLSKRNGPIHKAPLAPITGWKTFTSGLPSGPLPVDSVINYAIQRAHQIPSAQNVTEEDEIAQIEGESVVVSEKGTELVPKKKKFKTIPNPLNRGIQFLTSCRIQEVWDQEKDGHYFVKAKVEPSMHGSVLTVIIILSSASGYVCEATCSTCKQGESFRCSHICAVLLLLAGYGHNEEVVTTGRPQYWGKGGKRKDPGIFQEKNYYTGLDVFQRSTFDPRPKAFQGGPSVEEIEEFKKEIECKSILSLQMSVLSDEEENETVNADEPAVLSRQMSFPTDKGGNDTTNVDEPAIVLLQQSVMNSQGENDNTETVDEPVDEMDCIKEACIEALRIMASNCNEHFPTEIIGTSNQGESDLWHLQRSVRATASEAKVILGLGGERSTDEGKKNFLRRHMWRLQKVDGIPAIKYGTKHESDARNKYIRVMRLSDPKLNVIQTGMWVNPRFPQLSCSPDGLVVDGNENIKLLEIKCPISMKNFSPGDFDKHLSKKQKYASFLKREKDGTVSIKSSSKYYHQIQMAMDILELQECDFVVWSPKGIVILNNIPYNPVFWEPIRNKIIQIHRNLLLPEFFLKKAYNGFTPQVVEY